MVKVLFVCLGNICRSPTAEITFNAVVAKQHHAISSDSAGTAGYHIGETADYRTRHFASLAGYKITHLARQFNAVKDFTDFDYIVTMDNANYKDVLRMSRIEANAKKILKFADFLSSKSEYKEIPDPYYGGENDFKLVVELCEDASRGLCEFINEKIEKS